MIEPRWQPIIPHLGEFQRYLAENIPPLEILAANDRAWSQERYLDQEKSGIFNQYGVYLIFAPDESLQYIGVAMNRFHDRIWSHDDYVDRRWTDIVPLPHAYYFLAPALEFFLICRLRPPMNRTYRAYTILELPKIEE